MSDLEVKKDIDVSCRAYGIAELKTQQREAICYNGVFIQNNNHFPNVHT